MSVSIAILAAGASTRFGSADKLAAPLGGKTVLDHVLSAARDARIGAVTIVAREGGAAARIGEAADMRVLLNPDPGRGLGSSLSLAAGAAGEARWLLILLGDMPGVTPDHIRAVVRRAYERGAACSSLGGRRMPPACFGAGAFAALRASNGEAGARTHLARLPAACVVDGGGTLLGDVDRRADLAGFAHGGAA